MNEPFTMKKQLSSWGVWVECGIANTDTNLQRKLLLLLEVSNPVGFLTGRLTLEGL
jgi:hypothetical protein